MEKKKNSSSPAQAAQAKPPAGSQPSNEGNGGARCVVCHRPGARWIARLHYGDGKTPEMVSVHRPCGKSLADMAPRGARVKLFPSDELRREWRERQARAFWSQKLQEAQRRAAAKAGKEA
jgi:hypothetical protein